MFSMLTQSRVCTSQTSGHRVTRQLDTEPVQFPDCRRSARGRLIAVDTMLSESRCLQFTLSCRHEAAGTRCSVHHSGVPQEVDRALRRKAARRKQSLNQIIIEELMAATTGVRQRADFHDIAGQWAPDLPSMRSSRVNDRSIRISGSVRTATLLSQEYANKVLRF